MAYNWLMMTSSARSRRFGYSYRQEKKKNKPKAEQETAQPTAARFNKTAVRFKPRIKAHGYSHCPTALLLLFLSLCERLARET